MLLVPTPRYFAPPPIGVFPAEARIQVKAIRMWVALARHHRNPRPALAPLLGGTTAAFCTLMEAVVTAWPDPFTCYPPCAIGLSADEATLLRLLCHAAQGDESAANRLLEDMLGAGDRARLWKATMRTVPVAIGL